MKSIVVACSYHHGNTGRVAARIAEALGTQVVMPRQVDPAELSGYDLIGFGSGIYDAAHDQALLDMADGLPRADGKRAFLFSTDGMSRCLVKNERVLRDKTRQDHAALFKKLQEKGYVIVGEWNCAGWNTNSFLKLFGGCNKGRPNERDLAEAAQFARSLTEKFI